MDTASAITILRYLLSPEDSSVPAPDNRCAAVPSLWTLMKAALWIAFSVIAAILLGKL